MISLTYAGGVALAAVAGVLAAPIYSVNPDMGSNLIITVFAVVVIGGMGSILGSIVSGFGLGVVEGLTKVFYPQGSATVVFLVMVDRAADPAERPVRAPRPEMAEAARCTAPRTAAQPRFGFSAPRRSGSS